MQLRKALLVIFVAYLLVTDEAEAFWGFLGKLAMKAVPSLIGGNKSSSKRKREIEDLFDPYQKDLDLQRLDRFFSQFQ
uniref:VpAmp2.0 n=1 Tax=Mesomexovis punctatus TaxID=1532993 RepID=NDB2_MESPU|nr:Amp2 precursor [Vaejovis punctatus]